MSPARDRPDDIPFDVSSDDFRRYGHQLIELMIEALEAERIDPVLVPASGAAIRGFLDEPLPTKGCAFDDILNGWRNGALRYSRRNGHPRFFAYVCPSADPMGMLADGMASALNQTVTSWRSAPAATEFERLVIRWLDELVGFGGGGGGLMVSGGSAANLHGILCAVVRAEREGGLPSGSRHRLTVYMSREGHVSMRKAAEILGLASDHVRLVDIDERRRMRLERLEAMIAQDIAAGLIPAVICASAGTANTGAVDPLNDIADVCHQRGLWLHVDGSYGAPAALTRDYRWMTKAFARCDSLSLDPHKWLFAPLDAGSILIRDHETARHAFARFSEYTAVAQTDHIERYAFFDNGIEMSRRFRALKVWTILKARGIDGLRSAIQSNIDLRRQLDERVREHPRLEALGGDLSISCFRYVASGTASLDVSNATNKFIVDAMVREGRCYLSPTTLDGRYALRTCIVNFRTTPGDIDILIDEVLRLGNAAPAAQQT